jgi:hypothetical protein
MPPPTPRRRNAGRLEIHRAFDRDIADNKSALEQSGRLTIPALAMGVEVSTLGPVMAI